MAMTSVTGNRCAFTATAALGRRICGDVAGWRRAAAARQMSVAGAYRELVSAGEIRADAEQEDRGEDGHVTEGQEEGEEIRVVRHGDETDAVEDTVGDAHGQGEEHQGDRLAQRCLDTGGGSRRGRGRGRVGARLRLRLRGRGRTAPT